MKLAKNRTPYRDFDHRKNAVVRVPLAHGLGPAMIDPEDYDRLNEDGWSFNWFINQNTVRVSDIAVRGRLVNVARLITRARPGYIVKYLNGRRLDLRKSNLYLKRGNARGATAANSRPPSPSPVHRPVKVAAVL